jgi:hypothetical protein
LPKEFGSEMIQDFKNSLRNFKEGHHEHG